MNAATRFLPGSEGASRHVLTYALLSTPKIRKLPVMNGACSIGRKVSQPAFFHERIDDLQAAVLNQMRTIHQDDRRFSFSRSSDCIHAFANRAGNFVRTRWWRFFGVHQKLFN